jgi:hypothetical protein
MLNFQNSRAANSATTKVGTIMTALEVLGEAAGEAAGEGGGGLPLPELIELPVEEPPVEPTDPPVGRPYPPPYEGGGESSMGGYSGSLGGVGATQVPVHPEQLFP